MTKPKPYLNQVADLARPEEKRPMMPDDCPAEVCICVYLYVYVCMYIHLPHMFQGYMHMILNPKP
jgi:hypothetical protein